MSRRSVHPARHPRGFAVLAARPACHDTAAIAPSPPSPSAVRKEGFGSHFIAPKTISGGSFACGAELETGCCRGLESERRAQKRPDSPGRTG